VYVEYEGWWPVRGFALGVFITLVVIFVGGYLFIQGGGVSMATTAAPLPLEKTVAHMALRASIGNAGDEKDALPFDDANMVAGVTVFRQHCAFCHTAPGQQPSAITQGMFPPPPQLFEKNDMVTDDPEGVTYWKVTNGIRLSGMPGFEKTLSNTERWQVTMLLAHADKLSPAAKAAFGR
jgi:mono/diheme cytochrome c family protein